MPISDQPLNPAARDLPAPAGGLASFPPAERWENWEEYDPVAWPRRVKRRYSFRQTGPGQSQSSPSVRSMTTEATVSISVPSGRGAR